MLSRQHCNIQTKYELFYLDDILAHLFFKLHCPCIRQHPLHHSFFLQPLMIYHNHFINSRLYFLSESNAITYTSFQIIHLIITIYCLYRYNIIVKTGSCKIMSSGRKWHLHTLPVASPCCYRKNIWLYINESLQITRCLGTNNSIRIYLTDFNCFIICGLFSDAF